jgi:hypothetical protein
VVPTGLETLCGTTILTAVYDDSGESFNCSGPSGGPFDAGSDFMNAVEAWQRLTPESSAKFFRFIAAVHSLGEIGRWPQ